MFQGGWSRLLRWFDNSGMRIRDSTYRVIWENLCGVRRYNFQSQALLQADWKYRCTDHITAISVKQDDEIERNGEPVTRLILRKCLVFVYVGVLGSCAWNCSRGSLQLDLNLFWPLQLENSPQKQTTVIHLMYGSAEIVVGRHKDQGNGVSDGLLAAGQG